jgi:two-component system, sensor histidine kinase
VNLLNNAVKFTEIGWVDLVVGPADDGRIRFDVVDTGIGFDASDPDRVFGRFQQADTSVTRRFGGTGLGLTISRELARLMGGDLHCESTPGMGSRFWLDLPFEPAEAPDVVTPGGGEVELGDRPIRILLADDHPTNRKVVELMLDGVAEVISVEDGQQAIDAFTASAFDLVLMDMQMPVLDGLNAVRRIRRFERDSGRAATPILMLTANAMPEHVAASRDVGADGHLNKPITAELLFAAIEGALVGPAEEGHDSQAAATA